MTLPLAPADRQAAWQPTWVLECAEFPHVYAIRDLSVPGVGGDPFETGESEVGGLDLVGGGAGPDGLHAWGRIIGSPTVTRRIADPLWPMVEIQDVTVTIADPDGALTGDFRAAPFTLSRYDAFSGVRLYEWTGLIDHTSRDRQAVTITGTSIDAAWLEDRVPDDDTIDSVTFPFADPSVLGQTFPWVFGNVRDMTLPCIADNLVESEFDYGVSADTVAALSALRRLARNPDDPTQASFDITFDELEPYPGQAGVLVNGRMEDWDPSLTAWVLTGAGATVVKTTTPGEVDEGSAAAAITRVGTNMNISQDLMLNVPTLGLAWWRGREISVVARVRATVAGTVALRVNDGVTAFDSTFHTGSALFEDLVVGTVSVPCVLDAAATTCLVIVRIITTNQTAQVDHVRVFLRARSWEEILRPDLYAGYTAIRFFLRQEDGSGSLYPIVADVNGLQPERNPVRAVRTLLSHPTRGAGRTVKAGAFDRAEAESCVTHEAAVLLDAPELFLPYRDILDLYQVASSPIADRSGHARHGTLNKGTGFFMRLGLNGAGGPADAYQDNNAGLTQWTEIPSSPAFSGQAISLRTTLRLALGTLPSATTRPIVEKTIGGVALSSYGLLRENNLLVFFVRGVDTLIYTVSSPLVDTVDEERWMDCWGIAAGGVLQLYRDGVLAATGSYTGALAEGDGPVLVGKFGTGIATDGVDWYDNIEIVARAMTAERIAALYAALPLDAEPVPGYDTAIIQAIPTPIFFYKLTEQPGDTVIFNTAGSSTNGAWVGAPTLGVRGPLTPERGHLNSGGAVRFQNNVAQYGVKTGLTLADAAGTVAVFYRPAALGVNAGIVEKCIGTGAAAARGTQWGLCQRRVAGADVIRFTRVTTGGTFTLDVPLVAEDVGRWLYLAAGWNNAGATMKLSKNGSKRALEGSTVSTTYTGTAVSGVGDVLFGIQGTVAGVRTRPGQGDIGRVSYHPTLVPNPTVEALWTAATWYNGGLYVDVVLREARQAQDWIRQFAMLADLRLGTNPAGAITVAVGLSNPDTVALSARDGVGDGERNLVGISGRTTPSLADTVRDLVVRYRPDLQTGDWLRTLRREVSERLDGQGRRIGKKKVLTLECVREDTTADRLLDRLRKRIKAAEDQVAVTLPQEARRLMEGHLVQLEEAHMGYAGEVLEVRQVGKALATIEAELVGWDESANTYEAAPFPSDAAPG